MANPYRTEDQKLLNFTKEEGIKIQKKQLEEWRGVMAAKPFDLLTKLVTKNNHKAFDGFDIVRGTDIDMIIQNKVIPKF